VREYVVPANRHLARHLCVAALIRIEQGITGEIVHQPQEADETASDQPVIAGGCHGVWAEGILGEVMGDREQARKLFQRAFQCQQAGQLEDASKLYQASIAEHPTAEAHTFLGWVYSLGGSYEKAIAECKRGIETDPSLGNPYNDIGGYLIELGRPDDAVPWLRKAMAARRYEARHYPHINMARIHKQRGDLLEALAELTEALTKEPNDRRVIRSIRRLQARVN
jgi:Tfp pilus assembly protein PilF